MKSNLTLGTRSIAFVAFSTWTCNAPGSAVTDAGPSVCYQMPCKDIQQVTV